MKISDWLRQATKSIQDAGIGTARLDALVLLEDVLDKNRAHLLAHPNLELTDVQITALAGQIARRVRHEPLAYIRGRTEFYGRQFLINSHVLEPRPESETMIDLLKSLTKQQPFSVTDVGAGSGALGITAKLELPNLTVDLLEIDDNALKMCEKNKQHLNANVSVISSDLLKKAPRDYDVILANLPYVPDHYQINQAAAMEPRIAIFGGPDGLDLYRRLFSELYSVNYPKFVLTESLPFQHTELTNIAAQNGYTQIQEEDFIQMFDAKLID